MQSGKREALADEALVVAALVVAVRRGDRRALDDLVAAYLPLVYNIVGRAMDGHVDVDDVVTPDGGPALLTNEPGADHVNARIAPLGKDRLLVSWEDVLGASCDAGTCTGKFGGTHLRTIDWSGKALGADQVVDARIAGDIAAMPDGSLVWAFVQATPDYSGPLSGAPTSSTLVIARLVG